MPFSLRIVPAFAPLVVALALLAAVFTTARAAVNATGALTGTVSNIVTGNLLPGAVVEFPQLGLSALTDSTGRYSLAALPAGMHEIVVSYTGLDPVRASVQIGANQHTARNFDLTAAIYQLPQFKVTGEREGNAAAITAQRNAENVKNVVAMDSFGNLPNMSAGELAVRLPGVAGNLDDEGNVTGLTVRGMGPALNRITVDGGLIASSANLSRQFQTHSMTGAMFDQLEVIKGHTPDKGADSLGGTINLKTRSPLSMREKRRVSYSASARWAPPFTEQVPLREAHRLHPLVNVSYQEIFDAFSGERNLGVALNVFYSENVNGGFRTIRDFENTTAQPAYLFTYSTQDYFNNRKQRSVNAKVDYRLSPRTKLSLNLISNEDDQPFNRLYEATAATSQNTTATGGIIDFTDRITRVRPVAASTLAVTETMFSFINRTRAIDLGAEHDFGRWHVDYTGAYSQAHVNLGVGGGGTLTNTVTGVGWEIDRTHSDLYPRFTQTAGPDIRDIANYRPGLLTARDGKRTSEVTDFRANAGYALPTRFSASLKAGASWREQVAGQGTKDHRWTYTGGTRPLVAEPSIVTWDSLRTGRQLPLFETAALIKDYQPIDPTLWSEDRYFFESQRFLNTRQVTEVASAAYGMTQGKIGRLGFLGGARVERTEVEAEGWVRARTLSTAAQQAADPAGSAQRDYANNARRTTGDYTDVFPSAHLSYDLTPRLKGRLSWSTSFGRPPFSNLVPGETPSEAVRTLTISNPALKPQYSENWDAALEYYFEPVGQLALGFFHKDITDYIVNGTDGGIVAAGADNGFGGDYAGFQILQTGNIGQAFVQGWELSYQQQLTFLPGILRGLGIAANYTYLKTWGTYAGTTYLSNNQVAGFIPETGNFSLSYRYRAWSSRINVNYTGRYINGFTAPNSPRNLYRYSRTIVNVGLQYSWRPQAGFFCEVANLFNEPQRQFRYVDTQMERTLLNGVAVSFGVSGRF